MLNLADAPCDHLGLKGEGSSSRGELLRSIPPESLVDSCSPKVQCARGHTFICGPTGSGKTVLLGFLVAMLAKHGATQVVFDKDRGLEILVRAMGGRYRPLKYGAPTGFNPLALPDFTYSSFPHSQLAFSTAS